MTPKTFSPRALGGFSLVEMLTVVSVIGLLTALVLPSVQGLQKAGNFTQSVYGFADSLNFARTYALANSTYVYVGVTEVDVTQNPAASPQSYTGVGGRVAVSMVATNDGTRDLNSWNATGTELTQVRPAETFNFLHIGSTLSSASYLSGAGAISAPSYFRTSPPTLVPMPAAGNPVTPFSFPLGVTVAKYNFNGNNSDVICFNPQGGVLFNSTVYQWLEIDLQAMAGTVAPSAPARANQGNQAAVVIEGDTGAVTVYRP